MENDRKRRAAIALSDTARMLRTAVDKKARAIGMNRAQWAVLMRLKRLEGQRQVDLAVAMGVEPITVARLVDRLEAMGVVERRPDPEDRRAKRLFLAAGAKALLDQVNRLVDEVLDGALAGLAAEDLDRLTAALQRIQANIDAAAPGCVAAVTEDEDA